MSLKDKLKYNARGIAMAGAALVAGIGSQAKAGWTDFFSAKGNAGNLIEAVTSTSNSSQIKAEYQAKIQEAYMQAALKHQQNENNFIRDLTNAVGVPNSAGLSAAFPNFDKCMQARNLDEFKQMYREETAKYVKLVRYMPGKLRTYLNSQISASNRGSSQSMRYVKQMDRKLDRNAKWGTNQFKGISAGTIWSESSRTSNSRVSKGFQIAGNAASALRAAIALGDESTWSAETGHAMNFNQTKYGDIIVTQSLVEWLKSEAAKLPETAKYGYDMAVRAGDTSYQQIMANEMNLPDQEAVIDVKFNTLYERQEKELMNIALSTQKLTGSYNIQLNREKMLQTTGFLSKAASGIGGYFNSRKSR